MATMIVLTCANCNNTFERPDYLVNRRGGVKNPTCSRACSKDFRQRHYNRFWDFVQKAGEDECWIWTGPSDTSGYGSIEYEGKVILAHRISYERTNGEIPHNGTHHGTCVRHKCDNPPCCNPNHLILGSHLENMADMVERGRFARKLTDDQVRAIKADGRSYSAIGSQYGIKVATVCDIKRGRIWTHIN